MNNDFLIEHFDTLTTASDGIDRLREMILQLAMCGELGTHSPGDLPANILLERIKNEKKGLIKDGKIKQGKSSEKIDINNTPYNLPNGWQWARLGDICLKITDGSHFSPPSISQGYPYITVKDIDYDRINFKTCKYISKEYYEMLKHHDCAPKLGDVLFSKDGTVGKVAVVDSNREFVVLSSLAILSLKLDCIDPYFLKYVLKANKIIEQAIEMKSGSAIRRIILAKIILLLIPVPPIEEQKRIVQKLDYLMSICDNLETQQQQERIGCIRLGIASLSGLKNAESLEEFIRYWSHVSGSFELILNYPDNAKLLRQTILQLAIKGKLVPQVPVDEPVDVLINSIRRNKEQLIEEGKIKYDGEYEPIDTDEIPFNIPKTWRWIRLGEITKKIGSGSTPRGGKSIYKTEGIPFIRSQNVWNNGLWLNNVAYITPDIHAQMSATHVKARDILLNITGASIGRSCIVPDNFREGNVSQHVSIIRCVDDTIRFYVHYCLISDYFQKRIMDVQVGVSREGLSKKVLKDMLIPLPPRAEQYRIVSKADVMMTLCDTLESQLRERDEIQTRYADGVIKNIIVGKS